MALKAYALTTVDRLADFLGITPTAGQEAILEALINASTEYIERRIGRRIKKSTHTEEIYDGDGSGTINLKNYPVDPSAAFSIDVRNSQANQDSWTQVNSQNYIVDYDAGIVKAMRGQRFIKGRGGFRVTYTAGYDFDNITTFLSDTEAGDLEFVAWKLAADGYNNRANSQLVLSERIGDYAVTFSNTVNGDPMALDILDRYSRMEVSGGMTPFQY